MFSPNHNRPQLPKQPDKQSKPMSPEVKKRLWTTVALTFILLFIYYGGIALGWAKAVMIAYFVAFAALIVIYLAYNRAFVNKDVTVDMLPDEWSEEKKHAFVESNRLRAEKSRWMVMIIIPFVIVFMCEALYLFVWDGLLADVFESFGGELPGGGS
ncbi:MAG: hypothetical protein IJA91_06825 [Clostridia bacterium]|nr:hypothetical protein [Clostridia bacterium]